MRKARSLLLVAATVASLSAPSVARAESFDDACAMAVEADVAAAGVQVDNEAVANACTLVGSRLGGRDSTEIPTLFMAWPSVGVFADGGGVGFPVSGVCILAGAFISPQSVQYVLAGSAQSIGPATQTRIVCGGAGMTAEGELIGPAAVAADTNVAPLAATSVCTVAKGWFIDGSSTSSRVPAGCSPRPSI
jgi:hypothetical protein